MPKMQSVSWEEGGRGRGFFFEWGTRLHESICCKLSFPPRVGSHVIWDDVELLRGGFFLPRGHKEPDVWAPHGVTGTLAPVGCHRGGWRCPTAGGPGAIQLLPRVPFDWGYFFSG